MTDLATPDTSDRLRALVAELDRLLATDGPVQTAAVNADGTPGNVAAGELIESAWGNATANTLRKYADSDSDSAIPISGNSDVAVSGMTDWLVGGIAVPVWATRARLVTTVSGIYQASGGSSSFELQTRLGVATGMVVYHAPVGVTSRATVSWTDLITITTTGTLNIAVMARRSLGDGVLRADPPCSVRFTVRFDW